MSDTTFSDIGNMFTAPFKGAPEQPKLAGPDALSKQPTQAEAADTASKKTLDDERNAASTSAIINQGGGAGLLDTPSTTSSTLVGT